jgi:lipopolysaccharide/colanic/teichoic acid biosynthesis glycosyltransferase/glycosyltransferase involved in cell wall biosynthesis
MKVPVSILIPVKNEARNLPRCLASVGWADEVWVVDSQSQDGTVAVAEAAGARVVQFHYKGAWPKKKNWALENLPFRNEWVFILDADETLPAEAEAEFRSITADPGHAVAGYWINRRFMFLGRWLRHAYYPNWNLRLFRHKLGRYERIVEGDTGSGDNEVHEHVVVQGATGRLKSEMDHFAFPSVEVFIEKHNRYSNWEARAALAKQPGAGALQLAGAGRRRRIKEAVRRWPGRPFLRFCYIYFWQLGFLDGRAGYNFARLHAIYEMLSVMKTEELCAPPVSVVPQAVAQRRSPGLRTAHTVALAAEAALVWRGMAALSYHQPFYTYVTLLPAWSYSLSIAAGVAFAMRYFSKAVGPLASLGWIEAARLSVRLSACLAFAVFALAVAFKDVGLSRVFVLIYASVMFVALVVVNRYQPPALARLFFPPDKKIPMLLIGRAENFPGLSQWLEGQRALGIEAVGLVDYHGAVSPVEGLRVVGSFDRLEDTISATGAKQVLMLEFPYSTADMDRITRICMVRGCRLMVHNNLAGKLEHPLGAFGQDGYGFLEVHNEPLEDPVNRMIKRALDLAVALPIVVLVLPPLAGVVKLAQFFQSPGPLLNRQEWTGRGGRKFSVLSFRTTRPDSQQASRHGSEGGPHRYPFGNFLDKSGLRSVPQFLAVLTGTMSVVGPAVQRGGREPALAQSAEIYRMRFFVVPGITDLANSHGLGRNPADPREAEERLRLDLIYARGWSVWLDLAIMVRTLVQVIKPPKSAS